MLLGNVYQRYIRDNYFLQCFSLSPVFLQKSYETNDRKGDRGDDSHASRGSSIVEVLCSVGVCA